MNNIRQFREAKGMSQKDLASVLNVSQQAVYKYEKELSFPSVDVLQALGRCFSVPVDDVMGHPGVEISKERVKYSVELDRDEYLLVTKYRSLSLNKRKTFNKMVDSIYNAYNGMFD